MFVPNDPFHMKPCVTLKDLKEAFSGQSGLWVAYSAPERDGMGTNYILDFYEGDFENVLKQVVRDHRRAFIDESMCGKILKIEPKRV